MHKLKLAAGITLVFVLGALSGSLGTGVYLRYRMEPFEPGGPPPHERRALLMKKLSEELDLTEAQRVEIEKILEESDAKMFAVRRRYLPEIKEIMDQSMALMKDKLDEKQKKKLEELHEKLENRQSKAFIESVLTQKTPKQILSMMKQRLHLTEEQERKIRPIIEANVEEQRKIVAKYREQDQLDFSALSREMHELQESVNKRLADILKEEQREEYRKMQEKAWFKRPPQMGRPKFGNFE